MPRIARKLLIAAMLALYGSVSLCGWGFHALSGSTHAGLPDRPEIESGLKSAETSATTADDCPVCQFHLQSQLSVESAHRIVSLVVQPRTPSPPRRLASHSRVSFAYTRAPPLSS
jgi:hypothetical protein